MMNMDKILWQIRLFNDSGVYVMARRGSFLVFILRIWPVAVVCGCFWVVCLGKSVQMLGNIS